MKTEEEIKNHLIKVCDLLDKLDLGSEIWKRELRYIQALKWVLGEANN